MKRIIAFVLGALTVLGNVVGVCGEEENLIQLTDYRYENMEKSEKGFTLANIYRYVRFREYDPDTEDAKWNIVIDENYNNSFEI